MKTMLMVLVAAGLFASGCTGNCNSVSRSLSAVATSTVAGDGYDFGGQQGSGGVALTSKLTLDPSYAFTFELSSQGTSSAPDGGTTPWGVDITGDLSEITAAWQGTPLDQLDGSELAVGQELSGTLTGGTTIGGGGIPIDATLIYTVKSYSAPLAGITASDSDWNAPSFLVLDLYAHDDATFLTVNGTLSISAAKATEYESCDPCNGQGGLFGCE